MSVDPGWTRDVLVKRRGRMLASRFHRTEL